MLSKRLLPCHAALRPRSFAQTELFASWGACTWAKPCSANASLTSTRSPQRTILTLTADRRAGKAGSGALTPAEWAERKRHDRELDDDTRDPSLTVGESVEEKVNVGSKTGLLDEDLTFGKLGVPPAIERALQDVFGATVPSESQRALLPAALSHTDVFLKDVTGSGKSLGLVTAVLSKPHPMLHVEVPATKKGSRSADGSSTSSSSRATKLHTERYLTTLIMVPTRELAVQLTTWIRDLSPNVLSKDHAKLVQCVINGVEEDVQYDLLKSCTPRILIGTPVRLLALYNRRAFDASRLQLLVLDEVDRLVTAQDRYATVTSRFKKAVHPLAGELLLDKLVKERKAAMKGAMQPLGGSKPGGGRVAIKQVRLPPSAKRMQVIACSATLNNPLRRQLTHHKSYMKDPVMLDMKGTTKSPDTLTHRCIVFDLHGNAHSLQQPDTDFASISSSTHFSPKSSILRSSSASPQTVSSLSPPPPSPSSSPSSSSSSHAASGGAAPSEHALADASEEILQYVARICHSEKVQRGLVFVHSSVSQTDVTDQLTSLGLRAAKLMNFVDYEGHTIGGGAVSDKQSSSSLASTTTGAPVPSQLSQSSHNLETTVYEARGLDLPDVSHVFILGPPSSPASYVHMAGRAGRYGKPGHAITLIGGSRYEQRVLGLYHLLRIKLQQ
ncbi:P-loop containing nucleoside triphosphate hydrolase protein [Powellomyces hirtus]|nr:P-loop containing nucleoside triphosphate hydrolase protein [Powellomyces hirtus]